MERGSKDKFMIIVCMIFCVIGFLISLGLVTNTMIIVTGVLASLVGVFHFIGIEEINFGDKAQTAFLYIGVFSVLFGIILFITGGLENYKASYILMIIFFLYGGVTMGALNCIKGYMTYEEGESGLRIATNFIFALATVLAMFLVMVTMSGLVMVGQIDYVFDSEVTYMICLVVIIIVPLVAFILMLIDYIANRGVTSYSSNRSYNKRHSYSDESSDYRDRASGPFYSVLSDKCKSVAREFSSSHELSYGRARFDVSVRINENSINYTIDVNATVKATSQYEMDELQRTLKYELENTSQGIYNRTESAIDKLRDKYQDFDGQYIINVRVGSVR